MEKEKTTVGEETRKEEVKPIMRLNRVRTFFHTIIIGEFFLRDSFFRTIPYLGYLTILAVIYISNSYYAEKNFRQIEQTKAELKELRFQHITSKSELMYYSKQTEIAKRVRNTGLEVTTIPPFKIFYGKNAPDTKNQEEN